MIVAVAGATGAVGGRLIERLAREGHQVIGLTRSAEGASRLRALGAQAIEADVFDADQVYSALQRVQPDAVIDQLSAMPKNPDDVDAAHPDDYRLRITGGGHVFATAVRLGVKRYIQQSSGFYLAASSGLADETASMRVDAPGNTGLSAQMFAQLEQRVLGHAAIDGIALRYGFLYGPGTWYSPEGAAAEQARAGQMSILGDGAAVWSFVHVDDAVAATIAALSAPPGIYNVVDDNPQPVSQSLPAFARWVGAAEPPPRVNTDDALASAGAEGVYYHNDLSGADNAKARKVLGFRPRPLAWKDA